MNLTDWRSSTWNTIARFSVAAQARQVETGEPPESLGRIAHAGNSRVSLGEGFAHRALEDRDEKVVLALEVQVHSARGHAGCAGDVGNLGVEKSSLGKDVDRRAQDRVTFRRRRRLHTAPDD